jgi:repressor LexA
MKSHIGMRIREARENKELDQATLAGKLGVATRTLQRWEKGEQVPDAMTLAKIGELTETLAHWLLTGEGAMYAHQNGGHERSEEGELSLFRRVKLVRIPMLSSVPGGKPNLIFHPDHIEKYITVDDVKDANAFALKVDGNSMSPRIEDGDVIIVSPKRDVRNGDICVVRVGDEDTLKKVNFENGYVHLVPLNHNYEPVSVKKKDVSFVWRVVKVIKSI